MAALTTRQNRLMRAVYSVIDTVYDAGEYKASDSIEMPKFGMTHDELKKHSIRQMIKAIDRVKKEYDMEKAVGEDILTDTQHLNMMKNRKQLLEDLENL